MEWPEYVSHKTVRAARIVDIDVMGVIYVDPGDGTRSAFVPTIAEMADVAEVGGWAMLYSDGFRSISPKKQFEEGYALK